MPDTPRAVTLAGRTTPVLLTHCGPAASPADIAAFERQIGHSLPQDYREFLLRFNGGYPLVTAVTGRDDDPSIPYGHGDGVRVLHKLETAAERVASYERLRTPKELNEDFPWPRNALEIASDEGGNMFAMILDHPQALIRFVDHEALDGPFDGHRVMAEGFTDLLMRFRSVEEQAECDRREREAEEERLRSGPFAEALEGQCRAVECRHPGVRRWIRDAALAVLAAKGYFSLHADPRSRTVLDLMFWLAQTARVNAGEDDTSDLAQAHRDLDAWWSPRSGGFGLKGFAPGFLDAWWQDRLAAGAIEVSPNGRTRMADAAAQGLIERLSRL